MSLGAHGILPAPQTRDRLLLRVELQARLAVEGVGAAAGDALLVAREGEHGERDRDGHVDADLAGFDVLLEARCGRAGAGEDRGAVAVLVGVDEVDGVFERVDVDADEHRAEDLFAVAAHFRGDVGDDRGADLGEIVSTWITMMVVMVVVWLGKKGWEREKTYKVAVGILLRLVTATVKQDGGTLLLGRGDQFLNPLLALRADDRTQVGVLLEAAVDVERLGPLRHLRQPVLGLTDGHHGAERHAALARGAKGRSDDGVQRLVLVAVRQHGGVVLGAQVGLHALAVGRSARVDVLAGAVAAHEADGLDGRVIQDEVDRLGRSVDDVDDARREPGLLGQFGQNHGSAGVPLRRLHDETVTRDGRDGDAP